MSPLRAILLGLVVLVVAWVGSLSPGCEPPKPNTENSETAKDADSYCTTRIGIAFGYFRPVGQFFSTYKDEINASSTFVIAIFTAILGIFTVRLASSTRTAAEAAKLNADALMNAEGAQLWMDEVKVHGIRTTPNALKLSYIIRNFGNSPGWVHHKPVNILIGSSLPEQRGLDQTETPETNFVPAKHFTRGETSIPIVIPQPVIDVLLAPNPTTFIFIYGSINYRDIFRRERQAGFAYKIKFGAGDVSESFPIAGGEDYWDYK